MVGFVYSNLNPLSLILKGAQVLPEFLDQIELPLNLVKIKSSKHLNNSQLRPNQLSDYLHSMLICQFNFKNL